MNKLLPYIAIVTLLLIVGTVLVLHNEDVKLRLNSPPYVYPGRRRW